MSTTRPRCCLRALATDSFTAALNASWTVDLFGELRNQERAAAATLRATQFDRDATQVSLAAQIATEYLQYRLFQLQYAIATRSAESQAEVVRITRLRFEQGAASRLDLEQVVSQLAVTRAAVPQAFEQADAARNALTLLLASTPVALAGDLPPVHHSGRTPTARRRPTRGAAHSRASHRAAARRSRRRIPTGRRGRQSQVGAGATLSAVDLGRDVRIGRHCSKPAHDPGRGGPRVQLHADIAHFRFRPHPRCHRYRGCAAVTSLPLLRTDRARRVAGNADGHRHVCAGSVARETDADRPRFSTRPLPDSRGFSTRQVLSLYSMY